MSEYITEIDFKNQFTVENIDLNTFDFPKLRVRTWSNLFGKGGSYAIEPVDGATYTRAIVSTNVDENNNSIRSHMQDLVNDWNEDPRANWLRILHRNAVEVAAYRAGKVAEFDQVVADSATATAQVANLAAFIELDAL